MSTEAPTNEFGGIAFSREYLWEVGPERSNTRIPVSDIISCSIHYGSLAHRPALQIAIGVLLLSPVIYFAPELLAVLFKKSRMALHIELTASFLGILGVWLIYDALRARPHLRVLTRNGHFKLRLLSKLDDESTSTLKRVAFEGAGLTLWLEGRLTRGLNRSAHAIRA